MKNYLIYFTTLSLFFCFFSCTKEKVIDTEITSNDVEIYEKSSKDLSNRDYV